MALVDHRPGSIRADEETQADASQPEGAAAAAIGRGAEVRPWRRRPWLGWYLAVVVAADVAGFFGAAIAARHLPFAQPNLYVVGVRLPYLVWASVAPLVWVAMLAATGCYDRRYIGSGVDEYRRLLNGALRFVAVWAVVAYIFRAAVGRTIVLAAVPIAGLLAVAVRYACRHALRAARARGVYRERVVLVGRELEARSFMALLRQHEPGIEVVAVLGGQVEDWQWDLGVPATVLTSAEELHEMLRAGVADAVAVVDAKPLGPAGLRKLGWAVEGLGIDVMVAPEASDVAGPRLHVRPVGGLPLVHVEEARLSGLGRATKSLVERAAAAAALVVLAPVLALICLAVKITSPGPALFSQIRVGRNGSTFKMFKFRSMVVDAEHRLVDLLERNECDGVLFKMRQDPRVTALGRFLRRYSLDELPQLWNVVKGDMSVVGPRPPLPSEVDRYDPEVRRRLLVKPGLTGLWQINGRAELSWEDSVRLDLHYVDNWSLTGDLIIVLRTARAVLAGRGAY
ncbi:MAG TPA: sugar transferase [Acidimicrobiales bacterium]|nr:sugar transferase [Acidimicrobiales bacterium]